MNIPYFFCFLSLLKKLIVFAKKSWTLFLFLEGILLKMLGLKLEPLLQTRGVCSITPKWLEVISLLLGRYIKDEILGLRLEHNIIPFPTKRDLLFVGRWNLE